MESLQFERADRADSASSVTCAGCGQTITTSYYEVNGNVTCPRCRSQIMAAWNRGSARRRFAKALGLGLGAAALGAGLYFGIAAATGYEFGLVAIVVGLLVGGAVRKGSNGRGGRGYQLLAMFLTYTAVVVTDSSLIARELTKEWRAQADSAQARASSPTIRAAALNASADPAPGTSHRPGPLAVALGLALVIALAYAAPVMIGIASPIHLLIAGFALYEAWKLNRGAALQVSGPYQASVAAA
jgi:DNA-directed RNA polymerase subunit RPC12/RpoP